MVKPPQIFIPKQIWNKIIDNAKKFSGKTGEEMAFGLFSERRSSGKVPKGYIGNSYQIKKIKEIKLKHISPGVWLFEKQKERGFYPIGGLRYVGSIEIQNDINLSLLDAYWFGREQIDIKIFVNSKGQFKGYWVNHKTGQFYSIKPIII